MNLKIDLAENVTAYADVHEVDGYIEIENIEIQWFDKGGWDHWALPRDKTEIEILKDEFVSKYREEKEAVA